ncbi:MAG: nucleotidyltransferase domain-containing protein [Planctomycetota bacterium]
MANKANSVLTIARRYIRELEKNGYKITEAFLFGSYAKGTAHRWSDIDIALVSPDFTGDRFEDSMKIVPFRRNIDTRLEPMPFKPRDFKDDPVMAEEIKQTGKRIPLGLKK